MSLYTYKAKDSTGRIQKGKLEAANQKDLVMQLREKNLYCFESETAVKEHPLSTDGNSKIHLKYLVTFCRQLSTTLSSGIILVRALNIIYDSTTKKKVRSALIGLYNGVQKGQSLSETMESLGNTFPRLLINMVRTGEASGNLDEIMLKMSEHYENELSLSNKIKTAMIYPAILSIASICVVIFMLVGVLPRFLTMFETLDLPWSTRMLVSLSTVLKTKWPLILAALLLLIIGLHKLFSIESIKYKLDKFYLKIPVFGKLSKTIYTSRFASTFGMLYSSGIGIISCIEISSRVLKNLYIKEKLAEVSDEVKKGGMLSSALKDTGIFDIIFTAMVLTGEESGALDDILKKTGRYFKDEADSALSKMVSLLEPIMIIILGFVIGFIVISIILPIFSMYSQIM